jgi:hypothetical protein
MTVSENQETRRSAVEERRRLEVLELYNSMAAPARRTLANGAIKLRNPAPRCAEVKVRHNPRPAEGAEPSACMEVRARRTASLEGVDTGMLPRKNSTRPSSVSI